VYYSGGVGGGSGTFGQIYHRDANGALSEGTPYYYGPSPWTWDWDATICTNQADSGTYHVNGKTLTKDDRESVGILRNSVNKQWTIGAIVKAEYEVSPEINTLIGVDLRTAEIDHFREVRDLLGGAYYYWDGDEFDTGDHHKSAW